MNSEEVTKIVIISLDQPELQSWPTVYMQCNSYNIWHNTSTTNM